MSNLTKTSFPSTFSGYLAEGFSIFPCSEKKPKLKWQPFQTGRAKPAQAVDWDRLDRATTQIGIATGSLSGLVVIDVDGDKGQASLAALPPLPPTLVLKTGRGFHHCYRWKEGMQIRNSASGIAPGVDVRGEGGYIIAPPSRYYDSEAKQWTNRHYAFVEDVDHQGRPIRDCMAELPQAWVDLLSKKPEPAPVAPRKETVTADADHPYVRAAMDAEIKRLRSAVSGTRNNTLNEVAFKLGTLQSIIGRVRLEQVLADEAKAIGLDPVETKATLRSALNASMAHQRGIPDRDPPQTPKPRKRAQPWEQAPETPGGDVMVAELNREFALVNMNGKLNVLRQEVDESDGKIIDEFWSLDAFKVWVGNRSQHVNVSKLWLKSPERRQYERVIFDPKYTGRLYYNMWRGFAVDPAPGDCYLFHEHLFANVARGDGDVYLWLLAWMAQMVQQPERKAGVSLVLRGLKGTGKSIVGKVLSMLFPQHYVQASNMRYMTASFNSHMMNCLLFHMDEGAWGGNKDAEGSLKSLVTEPTQMIERKGMEPMQVKSYVRVLITSNEDWVVPATADERRFCVLEVGEGRMQDNAYFDALMKQLREGGLAELLRYLLEFDLASVDLNSIPRTTALQQQQINSLPVEMAWWMGILEQGYFNGNFWPDMIPKGEVYESYCQYADKIGVKRKLTDIQFGGWFKRTCPGITDRKITEGGRRTWAYYLPGHQECVKTFTEKQKLPISIDFSEMGQE